MADMTTFSVGLVAGLLFGALLAGLWTAGRLKSLQEQKTLLTQARQELAESFKALSGEALKTNNQAFCTSSS